MKCLIETMKSELNMQKLLQKLLYTIKLKKIEKSNINKYMDTYNTFKNEKSVSWNMGKLSWNMDFSVKN
jgi:hypothetical protein